MATRQPLTLVLAVVCSIVCYCGVSVIAGPVTFEDAFNSSRYPFSFKKSENNPDQNSAEVYDNPSVQRNWRRSGRLPDRVRGQHLNQRNRAQNGGQDSGQQNGNSDQRRQQSSLRRPFSIRRDFGRDSLRYEGGRRHEYNSRRDYDERQYGGERGDYERVNYDGYEEGPYDGDGHNRGGHHGGRHHGGGHHGGMHHGRGHHGGRHHGGHHREERPYGGHRGEGHNRGSLHGEGNHGGGHHRGGPYGGGHHGGDHHGGGHHGEGHHRGGHHGGHRHGEGDNGGHHGGHHNGGCHHGGYHDGGSICYRRSNRRNRYPSYQRDHSDDWRSYDPHCGVKGMVLGQHCTQNYEWAVIPPPPYDREMTKFYDAEESQPPPTDDASDHPRRRLPRSVSFRVSFGNGNGRAWWKGPNVCKNKTTEVTNITDSDLQVHQGSYSKACDQSFFSVRCKTTIIEDAEKMEELEIMECCPGYSRKIGDFGCPIAVKLVDTFTFLKENNLTNFMHALQTMGLEDDFQNENITMFAPINSGFQINGKPVPPPKVKIQNEMLLKNVIIFSKSHADKNMEDITDTLLYHVVPGLVKTNMMSNDDVITTASPLKSTIRVNTYYNPSKVVTANCVRVKSADHQTKNGVVHIVEKLLEPVTDTLLEYIKTNPDLSDFSKVIEKAGLSNMLDNDGHLTVFAPTNSAFASLEKRLYKKLLQGGDECSNVIVKNHILGNVICTAPIVGNVRTPNILKEHLQMSRDEAGKLFVNNAQMVVRDVLTTNGVIHIIDDVLVPESAKNFLDIAKSKNADIFANLFRDKELTKYFSQLKNITVYLPTNEAMKVMAALYKNTDVKNNQALMEILKYHFAKGVHSWSRMYNNMELDTLNNDGKKLRINEYARFSFNTKWTHTVQCVRTLTGPIRTCNGIVYLIEKMLTPPESDVMTILRKDSRLTTFVNALNKTGLINQIQNKTEAFTIFAPTNDAFNKLNARQREQVESNPSILSAYIYDTSVCCSSLEGSGFRFRGGHIISCDNMATDGVVHIVDRISVRKRHSWWHRFFSFDNIF